ncbi:Uncharacterized protein dnm_057750 [Desulfonema magnum]|uniref:Uncharacterized protein n=1 Tax=Desulfonema magnum TaxID=45655 RepID=A0A975BQV2_9BACT|nr:Uncharacterized protein dnm_057750 [Desulfonema magnum]
MEAEICHRRGGCFPFSENITESFMMIRICRTGLQIPSGSLRLMQMGCSLFSGNIIEFFYDDNNQL